MNRKTIIKSFAVAAVSAVLLFAKTLYSQETANVEEMMKSLDGHSLAVYKDGKISYQDEHGIEPLLIQIEKNGLDGATAVDRIIGKAAALLMVYGKVKEVHTKVIAEPAIKVFNKYKVKYTAQEVVSHIENKTKTGLCPMEQKCLDIDSPEKAYEVFKRGNKKQLK